MCLSCLLELGDKLVKLLLARDDLLLGGGVLEAKSANANHNHERTDEEEDGGEDGERMRVVAPARDAVQVDAEQADDDGEEEPSATDDCQVVLDSQALLLQLLSCVALHHVLHGEQTVAHSFLLLQHLSGLFVHLVKHSEGALFRQMCHELVKNLLPCVERPFYSDDLSGQMPDFSVQDYAQQCQILIPFPAKTAPVFVRDFPEPITFPKENSMCQL